MRPVLPALLLEYLPQRLTLPEAADLTSSSYADVLDTYC